MRNKSRQAILKAALRLFAHKGYAETTTEDIAHAVMYLASPQAGFVTGTDMMVSGG